MFMFIENLSKKVMSQCFNEKITKMMISFFSTLPFQKQPTLAMLLFVGRF